MSHQGPHPTVLYSFPHNDELVDAVAEFVLKAQNDAIKKRGAFCLAISGGSLPNNLKGLIGKEGVQWDKWLVFLFIYLYNYWVCGGGRLGRLVMAGEGRGV